MAEDFSRMSSDSEQVAGQDQAQGDRLRYPRSVVATVLVFCAGILLLTGWNLRTRFKIDVPKLGDGITAVSDYAKTILDQQDEQLKLQDSDQDGLTDYEELRVYGTSPFIADSDSDGITDAQEIAKGTDPNCPTGKTCGLTSTGELAAQPASSYDTSKLAPIVNDPAKIRQLLIEGGIDARVLSTIDDQSLQLLAQEAVNASTQTTPEKIDLIKNLTPVEIRKLLKQQGVDEKSIDAIPDADLMQVYQQALSEVIAAQ